MDEANPTTGRPAPTFSRGLLVGVVLGAVVAGGAGLFLWKERTRQHSCALIPVVVAAQDIAPGTELTYEMLKQRAFSPWNVGPSAIRSDSVNRAIGARTLFPLKAEDTLTWTGLSVGLAVEECRRACEWVEEARGKKMGMPEP